MRLTSHYPMPCNVLISLWYVFQPTPLKMTAMAPLAIAGTSLQSPLQFVAKITNNNAQRAAS